MAKEDVIRAKLAKAQADVMAYRGSALYLEFIALLDAIEACYCEELLTVSVEQLRYKQGAAAQVRLLRNALLSDGGSIDVPKV